MKHRLSAIAALVLGSTFALPASSQSMKPGLWEVTSKMASQDGQMQSAMAEMQKALADMDPEQRKQMEAMMAKQGVKLGGASAGGMRSQMCISPEMAKRNDLPMQQQGDCKYSQSKSGTGKMKFSFTCNNPRSSGEGEVNYTGDTAYTMKMNMSGARKSDAMTMDASAKWLAADCGSLKPFSMPKTK